jgi:formylglycine-generating enzyme required for sulfatase activity
MGGMVGAGMVEIPAGRFRMGSVGFHPEEGLGSAKSR